MNNETFSETLQAVDVELITNAKCSKLYTDGNIVDDSVICAGMGMGRTQVEVTWVVRLSLMVCLSALQALDPMNAGFYLEYTRVSPTRWTTSTIS